MSTEARGTFTGGRTTFGEPDVRADTLADRAEFLTARLTPVSCRSCATEVLVRKNSEQHTSIQWTSEPASSCPRYAEEVARGGNTALLDTCIELSESIATAAAEGEIPVGPEDCSQVRGIEPEDCSRVGGMRREEGA
ncbi:hypothetical protein [Haloechinothrix salitolerans]|uniref:Ferredoxin n=1 Tax=Haloechinothrix salitolerans TaxID=926830 RepID=A0ABW2BU69_9PSEU